MKAAGIINKKGLLLDTNRTKEIRKKEAEIKLIPDEAIKKVQKRKFNLR